jgi:small ribosomal subunit Rsm22
MDWSQLDWEVLDRLRNGFLNGSAADGPYWRSAHDLAQYDLTFGERIGWKWDAVLKELLARRWRPSTSNSEKFSIVDWGCGSGVAGRRVVAGFGADHFAQLLVWDHSRLALDFAIAAGQRSFPDLLVRELRPADQVDVLVVSHVINELSAASREELLGLMKRAQAVIWVEPGTHVVSREIIAWREKLRAEFHVVAPCTHAAVCGLLAPENSHHWCHYFAAPPPAIYADSDWVRFGQRAGIDLRSLPYSFLVLDRMAPSASASDSGAAARIIGFPQHHKGFVKVLGCDVSGVSELILQKRDDPILFKALKRSHGVPVYRWKITGTKISEPTQIFPDPLAPIPDPTDD